MPFPGSEEAHDVLVGDEYQQCQQANHAGDVISFFDLRGDGQFEAGESVDEAEQDFAKNEDDAATIQNRQRHKIDQTAIDRKDGGEIEQVENTFR